MITIFESVKDWQKLRTSSTHGFRSLGLVATMGALHDGHLELVKKSCSENDRTLVTIFVNPTQLDDPQDLKKYPKTIEKDLELLEKAGANYVLVPNAEEIYSDQYRFQVNENEVSQELCGKHRPGHFQGVLTVVLKLLNIADASRAYFGEKDFQQYKLIKDMADAFFLKTQIVPCATVRESDGLAMSSRNTRLSTEMRKKAAHFSQALISGVSPIEIEKNLKGDGFKIDYIEEKWGRRFGAVHLDGVRLIDNVKI
jgi:pantoate--beta-alanine ligase